MTIGIVTFPIGQASLTPLSNVVSVSCSISDEVYIITGNSGAIITHPHLYPHIVNHKPGGNVCTRITNYLWTQLKILLELAKLTGKVDVWLFPIGGDALMPVMLLAKLLHKPTILALASSAERMLVPQADILAKMVILITKINYALADRIAIYSENLIGEWHLCKHRDKIVIAHEHVLAADAFTIQKRLQDRDILVGYIGRLSAEKGILNFLKAISIAPKGTHFFIGGDGKLKGKVEEYMTAKEFGKDINFVGWIPRGQLSFYLNELKLLVIPSHTEGLPNILLEAMACGTPVLATAIGAIPSIIKDGVTGFILKDASPEAIAAGIRRVMESFDLDRVAVNAKKLVTEEYTFEAALYSYKNLFKGLIK